jgi:DNA gyrase/topoisomerase IV subunit A
MPLEDLPLNNRNFLDLNLIHLPNFVLSKMSWSSLHILTPIILPLKNHQSISSIMPLPEDEAEWKNMMIIFATSKGNVRKNTLEDFININNSGKIAMKLD